MLASPSSQSATGPLEMRPATREILARSKSVPGPSAEDFLDQLSDPRQHQDHDYAVPTYRADQDILLLASRQLPGGSRPGFLALGAGLA